ncbi:unnamed protein product [Symbiodinium natans]|uniref:Uncharacterized protein n=1 Tax=Symbiodinium natans TaxID=878477 RepID=A0A812LHT7_9DINO|nr:unnamed protein product [Symbiodinium natans]
MGKSVPKKEAGPKGCVKKEAGSDLQCVAVQPEAGEVITIPDPKTKKKDREQNRTTVRARLTPTEMELIREYRSSDSTPEDSLLKLQQRLKAVYLYDAGLKAGVCQILTRLKQEKLAAEFSEEQSVKLREALAK